MCGFTAESALVGSSWLPLMFPLGMVVGGVLVGMGVLVLWFLLRTSPSWLFLSRQAQQHDWGEDHFSTFGEEHERRGSEYRMKPPESLKW